jgi:nucleotide-binding universal stress UspA family protein
MPTKGMRAAIRKLKRSKHKKKDNMRILVSVEDILFGSAIADFIGQHQWPDDTEFRIVNVIEPYFLEDVSHAPFAKMMEMSGKQIIAAATNVVNEVANSIRTALPQASVSKHVIEGHIKEQIVSVAKDWPADLIIAGSHGRSGFNRFMLGSVSLMLVSETECPILLIKPGEDMLKKWDHVNTFSVESKVNEANKNPTPSRVLFAVDNTKISEQMIDFAIKHTWTQPAHFKLLSVINKPGWMSLKRPELEEMYQDAYKVREQSLRKLALKMRDHFHSPHIEEELIEGDPRKSIVTGAEIWGADLIVLGCHYRPALQRFALGSVSLAVLCTSSCSVLLLRERAMASTASRGKETETSAGR